MEDQKPVDIPGDDGCVRRRLEEARQDLLDLTSRTRLLNTPRGLRPKTIEVVDEFSEEIFRILVTEGRKMSFLPLAEGVSDEVTQEEDEVWSLLAQPDEPLDDRGIGARHVDRRLQTKMPSVRLQRRLLQMYYDARAFEQEQGVNILFLALGFLKWFDGPSSQRPRYAPLVLVPLTLDRTSAQRPFQIQYSGEDLNTNLSLQAKIKTDFGMELPDLEGLSDESESERPVGRYLDRVKQAVTGDSRWEVLTDDIVMGFYSFAKFLMYRDLDPDIWPARGQITEHPILDGLLCGAFESGEDPFASAHSVDEILDPKDAIHVLDADSSQMLAIEDVRRGRSLIIQGPPGTGKSQTIGNVIAAAVANGRSVLFVAEKMAALEVVKRRLDAIGLGPLCLELHSHRAKKKTVLEELRKTLRLGQPQLQNAEETIRRLGDCRKELNDHVRRMHAPLSASGFTPFQIAGQLVRLRSLGGEPGEFAIPGARSWSREELETATGQVFRLARHLGNMGTPARHPWRGVGLRAVLPQDVRRILTNVETLQGPLNDWVGRIQELSTELGVTCSSVNEVQQLVDLARLVFRAPPADLTGVTSPCWTKRPQAVRKLIETGERLVEVESQVGAVLIPEALDKDLSQIRTSLKAHGNSVFRLFRREYREAVSRLRALSRDELPKELAERVRLLDLVSERQAALQFLDSHEELGTSAFGAYWRGRKSDWPHLRAILDWVDAAYSDLTESVPSVLARVTNSAQIATAADGIEARRESVLTPLGELIEALDLVPSIAWGCDAVEEASLDELVEHFGDWLSDPEGIPDWITYRIWDEELRNSNLEEVADLLSDGRLDPDSAVARFRATYFGELMRQVFDENPELVTFKGRTHEDLIAEFQQVDRRRIELARAQVAASHHAGLPRAGGGAGEIGILTTEFNKRRRHLPLRRLFSGAGNAIQAIKPVFMMSPMSIAQYLEPGKIEFDLVLMDEASQIRPVEALGAIARGRQVVVVGDDKQLPPTRFFDKIAGSDEASEDDEFAAGDLESVLGLCQAKGIFARMLEWHYRSRHESLIAVSNREFYDDRLFIVPSSGVEVDVGLKHQLVDGTYDRGGSSTNRVEAEAVARAVIRHARERPELTLGVGTFSVAQRDAVLDALELLRRDHPETEKCFADGGPEPFFVKNLESVQGDERDVILISIGYARDESGFFAMNFGPLNAEGGERRLNVLITRARRKCEVYSSISWGDIDLRRTQSKGAAALKTFLQYAETGVLEVPQSTDRPLGSDFEEEVGRSLSRIGFQIEYQVGVAGFFVDLGVRDPESPGRFLLGIECDGATYHSARSARDRDRLRQQVLEDRGWTIHRIWSTDWFQQPEQELRRAVEAIERARSLSGPKGQEDAETNRESGGVFGPHIHDPIERSEPGPEEFDAKVEEAEAYREASFSHRSRREPHEAPTSELVGVIMRIVKVEEPIHIEELARRLAMVWGKGRAGRRIREETARAARTAVVDSHLRRVGDFIYRFKRRSIEPRSRRHVSSQTLRRTDMIPPEEIRAGLRQIVRGHFSIAPADAATVLSRLLGFDRLGGDLRAVFEREIRLMLRDDELKLTDSNLQLM